jgi:hypothetical protein
MMLGKENLDTLTSHKNLELVPSDQGMYEQTGRDASTSIRAVGDGAGQGASFHTNEHENLAGVLRDQDKYEHSLPSL